MIYYQNNENIYVLLTLLNDSMLTNFKQHILRNFSIINFRDLQTMSGLRFLIKIFSFSLVQKKNF